MKNSSEQIHFKDERDKMIDINSKSHTLEWVTAATQILTVICFFKGNPAWKGILSVLFFGAAFILFYKFKQYKAKPYKYVGAVMFTVGMALFAWFAVTV